MVWPASRLYEYVAFPENDSNTYVVKELGTSVPLAVVGAQVALTELNIKPEPWRTTFSFIPTVHDGRKTYISEERRPSDFPLVRREREDVGAGRGHLATCTREDRLLLEGLDLEWLEAFARSIFGLHQSVNRRRS